MARMPATVAIGSVDYSVREDAGFLASVRRHCGDHRLAETDITTTSMVLDPDLSDSRKREVLVHECVHALLYEYNCRPAEDEAEENLVQSLGNAVLALVRDNPALIAFLVAS